MMSIGRAVVWGDAWELVGRERRVVLAALACAVLGPVAAMCIPFAAKLVVDEVVGRGRLELVLPIALGAGMAIVIQGLTAFGSAQAGALAAQRIVARLRQRLQRHILRLPVRFFDTTPTGTLVSRLITDAEQVHNLLGTGMLQLVSGGLTAVLALAVLFYLNWQLTAVVAIALVVVTVGLARGFDWMHPAFRGVSELQATLAGRLTETFCSIRVVKTYAAERREAHRFARATHDVLRATLRANAGVSTLIAAIALATGGLGLVLLVLGGQAVAAGAMTLGDLAMFVFLVGLLSTPLVQVAAIGSELSRALAALARIRAVLALPTEEARDRGKRPVLAVGGAVVFDNVSYAYVAGQPVLKDVSFEAPAGSITALIGPNGAGKSTLLGLLLGFDDPTSGRILIDGQPLAGLRRRDVRRQSGVVLQGSELFDGTIAENIRYGRPGASAAEFHVAARLAHCDEFADRLPDGYQTVVGERGVRLSGGQRQRVAIARALLADPRLLILDEATAHLDSESEALIEDALGMLCSGRTTFVIAHRLATIRRAHQILVLQSGAIVQRVTHGDLAGQGWRYRDQRDVRRHQEGEESLPKWLALSSPHAENGGATA